jgi:hypothetical protein
VRAVADRGGRGSGIGGGCVSPQAIASAGFARPAVTRYR